MLDKINQVIELQKELENEYSIIGIRKTVEYGKTAQVHSLDSFLDISEKPINIKSINDDTYRYELFYKALDITFVRLITESEFVTLKNSPAGTRLKENTDNS